jgi:pimeloyl-ACP methyl ester carboxylesterase
MAALTRYACNGDVNLAFQVHGDGPLDLGSERAALFSYTAGGPLAAIFAARFPERVSALVLYGCMLRAVRDDDLPWLPDAAERNARFEAMLASWGEGVNIATLAPSSTGSRACPTAGRCSRLTGEASGVGAWRVFLRYEGWSLVVVATVSCS